MARYRRLAAMALTGISIVTIVFWWIAIIRPAGLDPILLFAVGLTFVLALGGVAFYFISIAEAEGEYGAETAEEMVKDLNRN